MNQRRCLLLDCTWWGLLTMISCNIPSLCFMLLTLGKFQFHSQERERRIISRISEWKVVRWMELKSLNRVIEAFYFQKSFSLLCFCLDVMLERRKEISFTRRLAVKRKGTVPCRAVGAFNDEEIDFQFPSEEKKDVGISFDHHRIGDDDDLLAIWLFFPLASNDVSYETITTHRRTFLVNLSKCTCSVCIFCIR